jgi:hypothetical protein
MHARNEALPLEYGDHLERLRGAHADLAAQLQGFTSITQVLQWMQQRGLCRAAVDIVGMDEFHYDFLIQLEPHRRWISFGVT